MPRPTLQDALEVIGERKHAAAGDRVFRSPAEVAAAIIQEDKEAKDGPSAGARMLAGTDLTRAEVHAAANEAAPPHLLALALGGPNLGIGCAWIDGLLAGLALAELRTRHDARANE